MKTPPRLTFAQTARRTRLVVHKQLPLITDANKLLSNFKALIDGSDRPLYVPACPSHSGRKRSARLSALRSGSSFQESERGKKVKVSQERTETAWQSTVASRYFVPPANTLLLNLCLHTRRASGKGSHPPYILKETHSRVVTRRCAAQRKTRAKLKWCFYGCALWLTFTEWMTCIRSLVLSCFPPHCLPVLRSACIET